MGRRIKRNVVIGCFRKIVDYRFWAYVEPREGYVTTTGSDCVSHERAAIVGHAEESGIVCGPPLIAVLCLARFCILVDCSRIII
jgi:hypothetical protein